MLNARAIAGIAALAVAAVLPFIERQLPSAWQCSIFVREIAIYAIIGLGLNLVTGWTGLLNLGCAAFVGVGAYAYAILTWNGYPFQVGFWPGLAGAVAAAGVAGALVGLPAIRLRGDYLAIVTLGFGEIAQNCFINLEPVTNGSLGLDPLPAPTLPGVAGGPLTSYWLCLALLAAVVVLMRNLRTSRAGRVLVAIREDELATRSCGVAVARMKLKAFAAGAACCGLGGALLAAVAQSTRSPTDYGFVLSITVLCLVILGGLGSIAGVILGAAIVAGFNTLLLDKLAAAIGAGASTSVFAQPNNWKYLAFGLALVLMMRFKPDGLLPERTAPR